MLTDCRPLEIPKTKNAGLVFSTDVELDPDRQDPTEHYSREASRQIPSGDSCVKTSVSWENRQLGGKIPVEADV
ncbi:hypothetical protein chiPu_0000447 [Chiloscyllium punctatum]|uniref:Uncharacterized protein n=1 Tax=Chiloscyllium punctatum TaxID=137246 RepID=A0A401RVB7_CHIPU|nr:hypothetical protein [Chiloscyllium punctatum]